MESVTIQDLARLAMENHIHTIRFASDGRTAVIKYYVGADNDRMLVEKRITPAKGPDGVDQYDVRFLNLQNSY